MLKLCLHRDDAFESDTVMMKQQFSWALKDARNQSEDSFHHSGGVVPTALKNTHDALFKQNLVPWKFHLRNANFEPSLGHKKTIQAVHLRQSQADGHDFMKPEFRRIDESYTIDIPEDGDVNITAISAVGIAHALNTFSQLFYAHTKGGVYCPLAPVHISDSPKFQHRGLNMDVSRNFYEVTDIMRMIDSLAYNKFNRLHLHITDSQAWPLEIPALPDLATKGAYHPSLTYSPEDLQHIQRHGALQGVEVFLEIDMPGHTSSIWHSNPDLVTAFNVQPGWSDVAAEPPSGTLKLNSSEVYQFLDKLWDDLLPRVSRWSSYFHTGGDEVNFNAYNNEERIGTSSTDVIKPLLQKFFDKMHKAIRTSGLKHIVWEEMLLEYNITLPKDVIVQSWQSDDAVGKIVKSGHRAIAGNYQYWYLDCGHGHWVNFAPGDASRAAFPYKDYCDPYKNWRLIYSYDPLQSVPEADQHLVIGGEASIWSEQTDGTSIDTVVWPRLAAAAEVLWSGAKDPDTGRNRSQLDASPRLSEMRERLVRRGVRAAVIQMPFCTQEGADQCALYG
ncbi:MAG: N-acetyl-glucosamine-6-phosphate deacetylase [Alyxoria varia]|nr:MAG: N-acetyl-glucosamine-6-phosphate deacetylase [Alyxoria varia]